MVTDFYFLFLNCFLFKRQQHTKWIERKFSLFRLNWREILRKKKRALRQSEFSRCFFCFFALNYDKLKFNDKVVSSSLNYWKMLTGMVFYLKFLKISSDFSNFTKNNYFQIQQFFQCHWRSKTFFIKFALFLTLFSFTIVCTSR